MARQFKTIEFDDRKTIASMYANGAIAGEIAQKIGVSRTTVYTELKRGQDGVTLDKNFRPAYDPELAQKRVQEGLRRRGRKKEGNAKAWNPYSAARTSTFPRSGSNWTPASPGRL